MKRYSLVVAPLLGACIALSQAQAQDTLTGNVELPDGRPGASAEISRFWLLGTPDRNGARSYNSVSADATGHFSLPIAKKDLPMDLVIFGDDRKTAAIVHATKDVHAVAVILQPVSRIRVGAEAPLVGEKLNGPRFLLQTQNGTTLGQLFANDVEFPFPQGSYQLSLSSADTASTTKPLRISSGRPLSLHFTLGLSKMAEHFGKQPPSLVGLIDSQNRPLAISSFDRPTLLYFWADWCQPCIAEGIPHLLQFAEAHKGERFQIIAIHENGIPEASSTATFQHSLAHLKTDVWKQQLSFPFAFDSVGKVTSAWGLSTFPTYALVDADGRLQREGGLDQLEALMKK